jgi:ubiquinone/menaquinone biosynthesis C-methylase UbiE
MCRADRGYDSAPQPVGLETMTRSLAAASNYHAWLFEQVRPFLGRKLLEVGGGSGNLTRHLARHAPVTTLDISPEALSTLDERLGPDAQCTTLVGDIGDSALAARLALQRFDTVVSSNVLEHIRDDRAAVANMRIVLEARRGTAAVIVPAHQALFGSLDTAAGHHRRYSRRQLESLFEGCGFRVRHAYYLNALGAIAWYVNGSVLKTVDLNAGSVNAQALVFDRYVVPVLRRVERLVQPPFGQSLVLVAQAI